MVEIVDGKEYFHVTRALHYNHYSPLVVGAFAKVGSSQNPFFSFYEGVRAYPVTTPQGQVNVPAIKFLKSVRDKAIDCPNLAHVAAEVAEHYLMLARELIMEQVRIELMPDAPSRQNCLWLANTLVEAQTWRARLGGAGAIAHLRVHGSVHRADASHLLGDSEPLTKTFERARKYWRGDISEAPELETLFCGSANVLAITE